MTSSNDSSSSTSSSSSPTPAATTRIWQPQDFRRERQNRGATLSRPQSTIELAGSSSRQQAPTPYTSQYTIDPPPTMHSQPQPPQRSTRSNDEGFQQEASKARASYKQGVVTEAGTSQLAREALMGAQMGGRGGVPDMRSGNATVDSKRSSLLDTESLQSPTQALRTSAELEREPFLQNHDHPASACDPRHTSRARYGSFSGLASPMADMLRSAYSSRPKTSTSTNHAAAASAAAAEQERSIPLPETRNDLSPDKRREELRRTQKLARVLGQEVLSGSAPPQSSTSAGVGGKADEGRTLHRRRKSDPPLPLVRVLQTRGTKGERGRRAGTGVGTSMSSPIWAPSSAGTSPRAEAASQHPSASSPRIRRSHSLEDARSLSAAVSLSSPHEGDADDGFYDPTSPRASFDSPSIGSLSVIKDPNTTTREERRRRVAKMTRWLGAVVPSTLVAPHPDPGANEEPYPSSSPAVGAEAGIAAASGAQRSLADDASQAVQSGLSKVARAATLGKIRGRGGVASIGSASAGRGFSPAAPATLGFSSGQAVGSGTREGQPQLTEAERGVQQREMAPRERFIQVKRAGKLERVFGTAPPKALFAAGAGAGGAGATSIASSTSPLPSPPLQIISRHTSALLSGAAPPLSPQSHAHGVTINVTSTTADTDLGDVSTRGIAPRTGTADDSSSTYRHSIDSLEYLLANDVPLLNEMLDALDEDDDEGEVAGTSSDLITRLETTNICRGNVKAPAKTGIRTAFNPFVERPLEGYRGPFSDLVDEATRAAPLTADASVTPTAPMSPTTPKPAPEADNGEDDPEPVYTPTRPADVDDVVPLRRRVDSTYSLSSLESLTPSELDHAAPHLDARTHRPAHSLGGIGSMSQKPLDAETETADEHYARRHRAMRAQKLGRFFGERLPATEGGAEAHEASNHQATLLSSRTAPHLLLSSPSSSDSPHTPRGLSSSYTVSAALAGTTSGAMSNAPPRNRLAPRSAGNGQALTSPSRAFGRAIASLEQEAMEDETLGVGQREDIRRRVEALRRLVRGESAR